tara:strand:+ start:297 stop:485 length:189 start_codon:yes stop_codon:yes gene_type:complete
MARYKVNVDNIPGHGAGSRDVIVEADSTQEAKNIAENMTGGDAYNCYLQSNSGGGLLGFLFG